jgi:hypothetical protein
MSNAKEVEEIFSIAGRDGPAWLNQAKRLRMSANVVLVELNRVLESSSDRVETMEEQLV